MKNISLKIDDHIFSETEKILSNVKKSRNRYINEAIDYYNKLQRRNLLQKTLREESWLVRDDSLAVLKDFDKMGQKD